MSNFIEDLIDEIIIFQPNNVLNGNIVERELFFQESNLKSYRNIVKMILKNCKINPKIDLCRIDNKTQNPSIINTVHNSYIAGNISSKLYENFLREYQNEIKLVNFFNYRVLNSPYQNMKQITDLNKSYYNLAFFSFLLKQNNLKFSILNLYKAIYFAKLDLNLLNSINLLDTILFDNSYNWNYSIYKIAYRILIEEPEIIKNHLQNKKYGIMGILTNIKKYLGKEIKIVNYLVLDTNIDPYLIFLELKYENYFTLNFDKISNTDKIDELYSKITIVDQENAFANLEISSLVKVSNLILFYLNILGKSNYNPDEFVMEENLTDYLLLHLNRINNQLDFDKDSWWFNDPIVKYFDSMVQIRDIIFDETDANDRLTKLIGLLDENNYITNYITKRILYFCVDNFEQVDHQLILQLTSKVKNGTHLTVEEIIGKLLENLIDGKSLSEQDLYYLNTYLNQDISNTFDYSQEKVTELVITLMKLERSPQMPLYQEHGTLLLMESKVPQERTTTISNTLHGTFLTSIPEELVDLIDDYQSLINYVKLFYEYQVFIHEWREYETIDEAYQELKNMQTVMETLNNYQEEIRLLKFEYPHIVDGITLDLLEAELILEEESSMAYGVLSRIDNKISRESLTPEDQEIYSQLLARCQS